MPTKKGAGGRQQNYDSRTGRFAKTDYAKLYPPSNQHVKKKREKERSKEEKPYSIERRIAEILCSSKFFARLNLMCPGVCNV